MSEQENTRLIPLSQGQFAIVDAADYEWLSQWKWYASWNKGTSSFYAKRGISKGSGRRSTLYMHSAIIQTPDNMETDHKNGITLDNRRENLRPVTPTQNRRNKKKKTGLTSKYKGVCWHRFGNKWVAQITINGRTKYLGIYNSEWLAALTYDKAARLYFGEFAKTNFI